jgi:predicted transglutaminase-like cysteine proteinase
MTVVLDDKNEGHAVLTIRTDRGDFVLDNKTDAVLPWFQTGYVFVKRESPTRSLGCRWAAPSRRPPPRTAESGGRGLCAR